MMFLLLFSLSFMPTCKSTKILVNMMDSSKSHISSVLPIIQRAQEDGHHVHFMETGLGSIYAYPPNIANTYFQIPFDYSESTFNYDIWRIPQESKDNIDVWKVGDRSLEYLYNNNRTSLMNIFNSSWDLVIGDELFSVSSHALAVYQKKHHETPFIITSTCVMLNMMRYHLSLSGSPLHRPSKFIGEGKKFDLNSFKSRLNTFIQEVVDFYEMDKLTNKVAATSYPLLGIHDFHISQLAQQGSYYFTEELNSLLWPAPVSNQLLQVGFFCRSPGLVPMKYRDFVSDPNSRGTILIAFGNHAEWDYAPKKIVEQIVNGLNMLSDYRIIFAFKGNSTKLCNLGSHIMATRWAPQRELITHEKTKVFISHGGLKSLQESICGAVPILIVPLFAEQPHNAEFARQSGIGDLLLKTNITAHNFAEKVRYLAEDPKYKLSMLKMREYYLDRPVSSLDLAAFAIRRAIKTATRGPIFRIKGMFLSWIDYFCIYEVLLLFTIVFTQL